MNESDTVAVLGMGIIGSRCADQLEQAGYSVIRWNRTAGKHPSQTDLLTDTSAASTLCLYLTDGIACREVFASLSQHLKPGQTILNHSTVDLDTTLYLAEACAKLGIGYLDCPFTGSKDAAAAGQLVYYVGGEPSLLESQRQLLESTSKLISYLGKVGDATVVKITTNLISACTIQAISEAMAISSSYGISAEQFTEAVSSNACGSPLSALKMPSMAAGEYDTHFSLDNMLKDSRFALALAQQKAIATPAIQTTSEKMQSLSQQGHGDQDYSALYQQFSS